MECLMDRHESTSQHGSEATYEKRGRQQRTGHPATRGGSQKSGSQTTAGITGLCTADGKPDHVKCRMHVGHILDKVKDG